MQTLGGSSVAVREELSDLSLKAHVLVSILWFRTEDMARIDKVNGNVRESVRKQLDEFLDDGNVTTGDPNKLMTDRYGFTTMVSPDRVTSISLCGNFIEMRSGLRLGVAQSRIEKLMNMILAGEYPPSVGLTQEIQAVTQAAGQTPQYTKLTDGIIRGHLKQQLDAVLPAKLSAAGIRLFLDHDNVGYVYDVGPDLHTVGAIFIRQRSKRPQQFNPASFKLAVEKDIQLWEKMAENLIGAVLRGAE